MPQFSEYLFCVRIKYNEYFHQRNNFERLNMKFNGFTVLYTISPFTQIPLTHIYKQCTYGRLQGWTDGQG